MKLLILLLGMIIFTELSAQQYLNAFLHDFNTLQADFSQHLYAENGSLLEEAEGRMYILRPNHFRWEYHSPYKQLIIANGRQVWVYDEDLAQVTIREFNTALGRTPALLLSSDKLQVEQNFDITTLTSRSEYNRLQLIPKGDNPQFAKIILTLDQNNELRALDISDNLAQTTTMHFREVRRNANLAPDLFNFIPPVGVDVVDESDFFD
jgi:outer membrane lipoprotein carrier protein